MCIYIKSINGISCFHIIVSVKVRVQNGKKKANPILKI